MKQLTGDTSCKGNGVWIPLGTILLKALWNCITTARKLDAAGSVRATGNLQVSVSRSTFHLNVSNVVVRVVLMRGSAKARNESEGLRAQR